MIRLTICAALAAACPAAAQQAFEAGQVHDHVATLDDASQSYALYLPSAYTPERKWPIVYAFDPGGHGASPVRLFRAACERHGWIAVGSNTARNGPFEPIRQAMAAIWKDTRARLSIDDSRLYATGFSGGSYVAMAFAHAHDGVPFAGVFSCGAGMITSPGIASPTATHRLGLSVAMVGESDFALGDVLTMRHKLSQLGVVRQRLLVFPGDHQWPPEEHVAGAVNYAELVHRAARGGDLAELIEAERRSAEALAAGAAWYEGYLRWVELAELVGEAAGSGEIRTKIAELTSAPRFASEQQAHQALEGAALPADSTPAALEAAAMRWLAIVRDHPDTTAARRAGGRVGWVLSACRQRAMGWERRDPARAKAYRELEQRLAR